MEGVLGWKKMINHLSITQSNPPYRFLRSLDCPFKHYYHSLNKMAYTTKDPHPPMAFSVPNRNKKLEVGRRREEEEGEKVSLLTHATARGMGKNN